MTGSVVLPKRNPSNVDNAPVGKVRLFIDEGGQLSVKDEAGEVVAPQELVTLLKQTVATKQDAETAATDAELTAAVSTLTTAINAKQDAASAATDVELAAAVSTLNAAIALKQDASTAATDAELAGEKSSREAADSTLTDAAAAAKATADAALPKAGGTMTGDIVLKGDPTANLHPATKQFVAAQIAALVNGAPGALDTLKEIADQLATDESALSALTAVVTGKLAAASNLSDLANAVTARTNLGLGTAAVKATGDFDAAGAAAAAQAASQPLDTDLTAIAALTTTALGRSLLAIASAEAGRTVLGAGVPVTVGAAPPSKGFATGALYVQQVEGKNVAIWRGRGAGEEPEQIADLSGTPAKGSVGTEQFAASNIDGAAGVPSARTLNTSPNFTEAKDSESASRKAIGSALAMLAKVWRSRHVVATVIGSAAQTGKKFWILNGQTSLVEAAAATSQPWRIGWVAADEAVEGLTTKGKIKAKVTLAGAVKATVHVALYKVTEGEKLTLGEEVAGSGFDIEAGENTNKGIAGESAEFTMPADGDYALGCTVSAEAKASCGVQARFLVHNV